MYQNMGGNIFMDPNISFFQIDFLWYFFPKVVWTSETVKSRGTKCVIMISNLKHTYTHPTLWLLYNKKTSISTINFRSVLILLIFFIKVRTNVKVFCLYNLDSLLAKTWLKNFDSSNCLTEITQYISDHDLYFLSYQCWHFEDTGQS